MTDPFYTDDTVTLYHGDCLDILRELPDASVDAVVTDPPYELAFMGRHWDASGIAFRPDVWVECLRVLKPGGHMLAFGGSRTWHRLTCAVEDAGFEIRDSIAWLYGSGFPKSLDVSKAIDKAAGAEREEGTPGRYAARRPRAHVEAVSAYQDGVGNASSALITAPATPEAEAWQGWGTALKPAFEPIVVARKPLAGTVAGNVLAYGTGALNIDGCRVEGAGSDWTHGGGPRSGTRSGGLMGEVVGSPPSAGTPLGRWPANVVLDESQAAELDKQSGTSVSKRSAGRNGSDEAAATFGLNRSEDTERGHDDSGGASRFFPVFDDDKPCAVHEVRRCTICNPPFPTFKYEPKAPTTERPRDGQTAHPTVKPLDLMRWLVRLVTPPGGTVLEPFAGSGTTAEACVIEGFNCIAIEREAEYLPLIVQRLSKPIQVALDFDSL